MFRPDSPRPDDVVKRIRLQHAENPDWHFAGFHEVDPCLFVRCGVEHVLFDLDGCLAPAYKHDRIDPHGRRVIALMGRLFKTVNLATNNEVNLGRMGIELGFDHLFTPRDNEVFLEYKPEPIFFERILRDLNVDNPATVLMIGDNPEHDVAGAQAMGMQTALVDCLDPDGFFEKELYFRPDSTPSVLADNATP